MNDEDDESLFFEALKTDLDEGRTLEVSFIKKDGTERVMLCVKSPEVVGASYEYKGTKRNMSPDVIPVWDLEEEAWRSFTKDSVLGYMIVEEEAA